MNKIIYFTLILLIFGLFIASPYALDRWQMKSALEASGGMPVYEGVKSSTIAECVCANQYCASCTGQGSACTMAAPPCTTFQSMTVTTSAGGMPCKNGYLLNQAQGNILRGAQNAIIGGTICTNLSVVASEMGCLGCTAKINNSKIYYAKNKVKSFFNFIIAGFKDKIK